MRIESEKKLFTSDDINKMYDAGILGPDDRVELLDGEIILMNPGRKHTACADRATAVFTEALAGLIQLSPCRGKDNRDFPRLFS